MKLIITFALIAAVAWAVGFGLPYHAPTAQARCAVAVRQANRQGLTGIERNVFVGKHGCVLRLNADGTEARWEAE